ncbi:MAG: hypothetical protein R3C53_15670 [Pirellulaceae bacterium]
MIESATDSQQHVVDPSARLKTGYTLFVLGAIVAMPIVQSSNSTGPFDAVIAMQELVWLVPLVVLLPWVSISTIKAANSTVQLVLAVLLLVLFFGFTGWMWSQWNHDLNR